LLEAERFAEKQGVYTYTEADEQVHAWQRKGEGHYDYFAMNILLQKAALDLMVLLNERPDVIHCQDGHAATLPAIMRECCGYRHYFRQTGALVTIHNAGVGYHQDVSDLAFARAVTGLPDRVIAGSQLLGSFDPFIAAAPYAVLNTVSENYARELQHTREDARTGWLGHALLEQGVMLHGITNGIDPSLFDCSQPELLQIPAGYDVLSGKLTGKHHCKNKFLQRLAQKTAWERVKQYGSLTCATNDPLCTFVGRLTEQKGVDCLLGAIGEMLGRDPSCCFLVFGSGGAAFEERLVGLAAQSDGRLCFLQGYDPILANSVYAAGDLFLIPSKYEPCGLTDYIAQLFGNLPLVHRVGGLVKVIDGETGFTYRDDTATALSDAIVRAIEIYRNEPDQFARMQRKAVERIHRLHTWTQVMEDYQGLYRQAVTKSC
jgi:starch synthase